VATSPQPRLQPEPQVFNQPIRHAQNPIQVLNNRFNESRIENRVVNTNQPEPQPNVMRRSNVVFNTNAQVHNNSAQVHNRPVAVQRVEQVQQNPLSQSTINRNVTVTETRAVTPQPNISFAHNQQSNLANPQQPNINLANHQQLNLAPQPAASQPVSTPPQATFASTQPHFPPQPVQINPISHNQPEKVESKIVFVNGGQARPNGIIPTRNEDSISSITGQIRSNEQISGRFSQIKEESAVDNSTRNFYTNMMTSETASRPETNNYYAAYTNKLYEAGS